MKGTRVTLAHTGRLIPSTTPWDVMGKHPWRKGVSSMGPQLTSFPFCYIDLSSETFIYESPFSFLWNV